MIRLATQDDIYRILFIYDQKNKSDMTDNVKYVRYDFVEHIKSGNINVYLIEDNVVGFIVFYDHITWAYIEILCIDEKYRNRGIGRELIDSVKDEKWDIIELCCHVEDEDVIEFVEKCGFIESNQLTKWYYKK